MERTGFEDILQSLNRAIEFYESIDLGDQIVHSRFAGVSPPDCTPDRNDQGSPTGRRRLRGTSEVVMQQRDTLRLLWKALNSVVCSLPPTMRSNAYSV